MALFILGECVYVCACVCVCVRAGVRVRVRVRLMVEVQRLRPLCVQEAHCQERAELTKVKQTPQQ